MTNSIISTNDNIQNTITTYEQNMMSFLDYCGLPSTNILAETRERNNVLRNIISTLELLDENKRSQAMYIAKFLTAVSSGLFDAAINYLWDETVLQLRYRVAQYDVQYFFDVAVQSPERRKKLKDAEDLIKIDDSELIAAAKEIDLITDIGYKHLDHIKYMRNWASAAHPNSAEITGLNLISWLEICIIEVINLPESNVTIETRKLLNNVRNNKITKEEADKIALFIVDLPKEKLNALANGFFGMYTRTDTQQDTRENIHLLIPSIWSRIDFNIKDEFGIKYARFEANNDSEQAKLARYFLQLVEGEQHLPELIRAAEIKEALENLKSAHNSIMDNFYKEPTHARVLERFVGTHGIPQQIEFDYVNTLINVYLSNGNGICYDADEIYKRLISKLNERQLMIAVLSFNIASISSKLQFSICRNQFREMIKNIENRITSPAIKELIEKIENYKGPLDKMRDDPDVKRVLIAIKPLIDKN